MSSRTTLCDGRRLLVVDFVCHAVIVECNSFPSLQLLQLLEVGILSVLSAVALAMRAPAVNRIAGVNEMQRRTNSH